MATAAGASVLPSNGSGKAKRKSYAREFKLTVVNHYRDHKNLYNNFVCVVPSNDAFVNQDRVSPLPQLTGHKSRIEMRQVGGTNGRR